MKSASDTSGAFPDTRAHRLRVYFVVCMLQLVSTAGLTTIYVMLTKLYAEYPDRGVLIGWSITSYLLVGAVIGAIGGRLGDMIGRRRMTVLVLAIAAAASLVSALSPLLEILVAGAAVQGVACALTPLAFGICREYLVDREVPLAVAIVSAAGTVSAGIVFVVAGWIVDGHSAHGGFLFKTVLSLSSIGVTLMLLPASRLKTRSLERIDFWRGLLFAPAVGGVLLAVQQSGRWGWTSPLTLGLLAASIALLAWWFRDQSRQATPLIAVNLIFRGRMLAANIAIALVGFGVVQVAQIYSQMLQHPVWTGVGFGLSASTAGLLFAPANFTALITAPWSGRIAQRHGPRRAALIGSIALVLIWLGVALFHHYLVPFVLLGLAGVAFQSMVYPAIFNIVLENTPSEKAGEATGAVSTTFMLSFAIGSQIIFSALRFNEVHEASSGQALASDAGFTLVFGYLVATALLLLLLVYRLPRGRTAGVPIAVHG